MYSSIKYFLDDVFDQYLDADGQTLFTYWRELRGDRPFPKKSAFDPSRVPRALPGIQIVEQVEKPEEFRYRLVGTREVEIRGWDPTGRPVAEGFVGPSADLVFEHYHRIIATQAPLGISGTLRKLNRVWIEDVSFFLPMAAENGELKYIFVYSYQKAPSEEDMASHDM